MEIDTKLMAGFQTKQVDNFTYLLNPNDKYISETLLDGFIWEPHIKIALCLLSNKGDTVVDIGANIGIHTMFLSRLVGDKGTVYSFEPVPLLFTQLSCHCLVNKCFNVKLHQCGISDKNGDMFISSTTEEDMKTKVNWGNTKLNNDNTGTKIKIKTLDSYNINPTLIKIDVECMELFVLKGMKETLLRCKPFVVVEIEESNLSSVMKYLKEEYDLYNVYNIWTSSTTMKHDYVLVPKDKEDYFQSKISSLSFPYFVPVDIVYSTEVKS